MFGIITKLAARNLWRQRRRTILTCLALAFGIYLVIIMDSFVGGMTNMVTQNIIDLETGHLQVQSRERFSDRTDRSLDHVFHVEGLEQALLALPNVEAVAPRLLFGGELNNGYDDYQVMAVAVDPAADAEVFTLTEHLSGQWLETGEMQMVVGARVAGLLDLQLGDYVILLTRTANNAFQALDYLVVGIADTPNPEVNLANVFIPLDTARAGLALDNEVTTLAMTYSGAATQGQREIDQLLQEMGAAQLGAYTWEQAAEDFMTMAASSQAIHRMLLAMLALIAAVGVVNAILLASMERTREIGMLKAMGMTEREVMQEFVTEAFGIGLVGSVIGVLLALATNWYLVQVGMDPYGNIDLGAGIPIRGNIYGVWNLPMIFGAFSAGILASVLAGVVPAIKAAGKDPIWALRQ